VRLDASREVTCKAWRNQSLQGAPVLRYNVTIVFSPGVDKVTYDNPNL
jgi:hypothetical protein